MRIMSNGVVILPPPIENLYKFVERCIHDESRFVFLAYNDENECIGYVYCDIDDNHKVIESSYGVYYPYNGKGYGTQIIEFSNRYGKLLGMKLRSKTQTYKKYQMKST